MLTLVNKLKGEYSSEKGIFLCSCGKTCIKFLSNVIQGKTTHCGCKSKFEKTKEKYIGKTIGKFTIKKVYKEGGRTFFNLICVCGKERNIYSGHEIPFSCGCIKKNIKHGLSLKGKKPPRIYSVFSTIKYRCNNKNSKSYYIYGGRGIKCLRKDFIEFYKDMGDTYKEGLSIDRINVNGHYCKENCRWSTRKEQANNKRRNTQKNIIHKTNRSILCILNKKKIISILHKKQKKRKNNRDYTYIYINTIRPIKHKKYIQRKEKRGKKLLRFKMRYDGKTKLHITKRKIYKRKNLHNLAR